MPQYNHKCTQCGYTVIKTLKIEERNNTKPCIKCGGKTYLSIGTPYVCNVNSSSYKWEIK